MITYLRFRFQRIARRYRRSARKAWRYVQFSLFGKGRQLAMVRRFVAVWLLLIIACMGGLIFQTRAVGGMGMILRPLPGGSYSEAVVGSVKTINPILPEGSASADATRLIFSGLTRFDTNGELQPDLASSWEISPDGKTYTFHLRHGVKWHDGVPFSAEDAVFTMAAIQNPDTRSPLASTWKGVRVGAPNDHTVVFSLPKPYTPFINATTVGLLPRHLLENTDPSSLRVATFNQKPIGTGPYQLDHFDETAAEISLKANAAYYLGRPFIQDIMLRLYGSSDKALEAYTRRQVQGVARLQPAQTAPATKLGTLKLYEATVPDEVAVFFNTTAPALKDKAVRAALNQASDRATIIHDQFNDQAAPLTSPLLAPHVNLGGAPHQAAFDVAAANAALNSSGWVKGSDGVRAKGGQRLELNLVTQEDSLYSGVAEQLKDEWQQVGARLHITKVDANTLKQSYIRPRHYDALLYGINVGADPDVYAYWDSSQAKDPGLNLSQYHSAAADAALEGGRIIRDPMVRAAKYRSFVQTFVNDTPAVMLYTPSYEYGADSSVHGIHLRRLINPSDRFNDVQEWSVRVKSVPAS